MQGVDDRIAEWKAGRTSMGCSIEKPACRTKPIKKCEQLQLREGAVSLQLSQSLLLLVTVAANKTSNYSTFE